MAFATFLAHNCLCRLRLAGITPVARRRPEYRGFALAVRTRLGGVPATLAYAAAHAAVHLSAAVGALLLLELGVETVIRYEGVGKEGYVQRLCQHPKLPSLWSCQ